MIGRERDESLLPTKDEAIMASKNFKKKVFFVDDTHSKHLKLAFPQSVLGFSIEKALSGVVIRIHSTYLR